MVCAKRTTCFEIVKDAPMELLSDVGLVESRFDQFETVLGLV
jgi:hypothetical protein